MILEEQRLLHEDIERLEQAIAERTLEQPKNIRERLNRDHQIANFLNRIQHQSARLLQIYADDDGQRLREIQTISTGDPFEEFYKEYSSIKDFHKRYPNEPAENLERAYKRRAHGEPEPMRVDATKMFTGEEGFGRFFDLNLLHETYLNLPGVKNTRRIPYLQYLEMFDQFTAPQCPLKRPDKLTDAYFQYLTNLAAYLKDFMRKIKPLEDLDRLFADFDKQFEEAWEAGKVPGWEKQEAKTGAAGPTEGSGSGFWCADCEKEFGNENVFQHHFSSKKHKKAAAEKANGGANGASNGVSNGTSKMTEQQLKEKAVAAREFRIKKLAGAMQTERSDTRVNVERRMGMTERERQQELEALFNDEEEVVQEADPEEGAEDKIYNPLKLPMGWDGKPIPFWLYKLHGLGNEFPCEICGNFVYMGRRAFDKHFTEGRHLYGLRCLGITKDMSLFREITGIDEALKLHQKLETEKKKQKQAMENVVQMEDAQGNVMPEKVYYDLQKQGLL
ncbi:splicing factor 3a subunit 3 [Phyllosticta capitalensis]